MSKNSFFLIAFLFSHFLFSQSRDTNYVTYFISDDKNLDFHKRQHYLTFTEEKICIQIIGKGDIIPFSEICFNYTLKNDTISIGKRITENEKNGLKNHLVNEFENQKIRYISDNFLELINLKRPYFSEKYIHSLRKNKMIFSINGTIKKINKSRTKRILKKYIQKQANIHFIEGEESYQRYGAIGVGQVIEITEK